MSHAVERKRREEKSLMKGKLFFAFMPFPNLSVKNSLGEEEKKSGGKKWQQAREAFKKIRQTDSVGKSQIKPLI